MRKVNYDAQQQNTPYSILKDATIVVNDMYLSIYFAPEIRTRHSKKKVVAKYRQSLRSDFEERLHAQEISLVNTGAKTYSLGTNIRYDESESEVKN